MSNNTLDNFSLYLWKNPEGYHITVTTNFNLPSEKRSFFSFGAQTYKSWRAYNLHQPEPLREFFQEFKNAYKPKVSNYAPEYWISKLAVNTGRRGRQTAPGALILLKQGESYGFVLRLRHHEFKGEFDDSMLSDRQRRGAKGVCLGQYIWRDDDLVTEYAEAF